MTTADTTYPRFTTPPASAWPAPETPAPRRTGPALVVWVAVGTTTAALGFAAGWALGWRAAW